MVFKPKLIDSHCVIFFLERNICISIEEFTIAHKK